MGKRVSAFKGPATLADTESDPQTRDVNSSPRFSFRNRVVSGIREGRVVPIDPGVKACVLLGGLLPVPEDGSDGLGKGSAS
jgi:hypothetical protein